MYECPICGKSSNRRGDPFETKQQVIAHVDGSHDVDHQDIRGEDIRGEIAEVSESRAQYGSEGTSSDSSETEDDSPSEQNRPSAQVSTSVRGEDTNNAGGSSDTVEHNADAGFADSKQTTDPATAANTVEQNRQHTATQDNTDTFLPADCPKCGSSLISGSGLKKKIQAKAQTSKKAAKWVKANGNATFEYGCSNPFGCGYYIDENGNGRTFDSPGSVFGSVFKAAAIGLIGLVGAGVVAALGRDSEQQGDKWEEI